MTTKVSRMEVSNAVFPLLYYVARDEDYFTKEGIKVELAGAGSGHDRNIDVPDKPTEDPKRVFYHPAATRRLPIKLWLINICEITRHLFRDRIFI